MSSKTLLSGGRVVDPSRSDAIVTLVPARYAPEDPALSPDGRWVAYASRETGAREVFVRPVAGGSSRWQISRGGGADPAWGRSLPVAELYYTSRDSLYRADVRTGASFEVGAAKGLFRLRVMERAGFDVLPRGLVMIGPEGGRTGEVEVVLNYLEEVRALAGGTRRR